MISTPQSEVTISGSATVPEAEPGATDLDPSIFDQSVFERISAFLTPEAVATYSGTLDVRATDLLVGLREPTALSVGAGDLSEAAHVLAGSAGLFGFHRLTLAARHFEKALHTASPELPGIVEHLIVTLEYSLLRMRCRPPDTRHAPHVSGIRHLPPPEPEAIAAVRAEFVVEMADTPELIREAQQLRYQVYCVERGFETSNDGLERDDFDVRSRHLTLRRRSTGEVVGTSRVILYNPDAPSDSYPTQRICDASLLADLPLATTAEVSRFAISRQLRGTSPALTRLGLIQGVIRISHELGLTDWVATMETTLLRLLRSSAINFRPLGPMIEYHGPRQPCCTNIKEVAAHMRVERPDFWAFLFNKGLYYGTEPAVTTSTKQRKKPADDWSATVAGGVKFAYYPQFQKAAQTVLDTNAPFQEFRPLLPAHRVLPRIV